MGLLEMLGLAVALAMDAFAVSLATAAARLCAGPRAAFRLAFHFGLFQALMPVAGWYAGYRLAALVAAVDHWLAFGLLALVGGRMIRAGLRPDGAPRRDPSRGWTLTTLCVATSIDALAVGFNLAMVGVAVWRPAAVIGIVTAALSLAGLGLGRRLGARFGARMEVVGGLVLIAIGVRILAEHLSG
ncbi:MAG: manganese efflux pump [Candidatus Krumholzibacteriota bacterium]|nr:manganese efflux pump [Candidatus Krumholzibacteriota bacterium]